MLLDSGADESFIDAGLAAQLGVSTTALHSPLQANALNGKRLASVTHITALVSLLLSGNHREDIALYVIDSPMAPIVLGLYV